MLEKDPHSFREGGGRFSSGGVFCFAHGEKEGIIRNIWFYPYNLATLNK